MAFRGGYWRKIRTDGRRDAHEMWTRRAECAHCAGRSHSLLPSFALPHRLDAVENVGYVLGAVGERVPVARARDRVGVPYTTARDWVRRFRQRAAALAAGFGALEVELGGRPGFAPLPDEPVRRALSTLGRAWRAARQRAGPRVLSRWAFAAVITGGSLLAATRDPPWFVIGKRRFMPPVP